MTFTIQYLTDANADRWQTLPTPAPITERLAAVLIAADSSVRVGGTWRVLDERFGLCWHGTGLSGRDRVDLREDPKTMANAAVDLALELAGRLVRLQAVLA